MFLLGMEALETSIMYWEDAMSAYTRDTANSESLAITNEEESEFCKELQKLLDEAYKLQDGCELLFLDQVSFVIRLRLIRLINVETRARNWNIPIRNS